MGHVPRGASSPPAYGTPSADRHRMPGGPLPCLALRSYVLDGTRTKLRFCLHILAHPDSRRGVSRKSLFVIVEPHSNIQKMSLEKGVTCFIWFMHIDGKNEQNILFLKMIQIRTNNTRSQSIDHLRDPPPSSQVEALSTRPINV